MNNETTLVVEELEARFELASFSMVEADESGSCSGSCCIVGGGCNPPAPKQ